MLVKNFTKLPQKRIFSFTSTELAYTLSQQFWIEKRSILPSLVEKNLDQSSLAGSFNLSLHT